MTRLWSPSAVLLLSICVHAHAGESYWPRFRGPNGAGISDATTVPAKWTDQDYNWKVKLPGMGHSSPVVWGNRLFVTCCDAKTALRMLLCLDAATGKTLWQRDYPSKTFRQHQDNTYAAASPAADADGVIIAWSTPDEVVLVALDGEGKDAWRRGLGPWVGSHGTGSSPIIADGLVILANDQEDPKAIPSMYGPNPTIPAGKSSLVAVDRKTGETRWQLERKTRMSAYSTPCISPSVEGKPEVIVSSTAHGVTGVDLATGTVNWEVGNVFNDRCVGSPVVAPGLAIAGYGAGVSGALFVAVQPGLKTKGIEPKIAYQLKAPVPLVPTPVVKNGRLFLWSDNGAVACLKVETGETVWREKVGGSFYGSPVWVDGRLYCIAKNGEVVVLAAADKFEPIARIPLGEASFATPAVADGVMYLRTRTQLFSLGGKRP
jgi:outer membrane protein assembly factor BamB